MGLELKIIKLVLKLIMKQQFSANSTPESSETVNPLIPDSPISGLDALSAPSRETPAGIADHEAKFSGMYCNCLEIND